MDIPPEMVQQGKLAWLGRGFEHDGVKSERVNKPVCVCGIQAPILIEQSNPLRAFPGFDDELECAGIEPFLSLVDPRRERLLAEPSVMFLPKLHLHIEAAAVGGGDNFPWIEKADRETLPAFDSCDADVRAQIQVGGKFALGYGNFKSPST